LLTPRKKKFSDAISSNPDGLFGERPKKEINFAKENNETRDYSKEIDWFKQK
jgi:hypothetical protein